MFLKKFKSRYTDEELEWMLMSPKKRFNETSKLWSIYLSLGGNLDPEPDPQSPFNFLYYPEKKYTHNKRLRRNR